MGSLRHFSLLGLLAASASASVPTSQQYPLIFPLQDPGTDIVQHDASPQPKLHGRFLHITDMHPDVFYKIYSSTEGDGSCHRGEGPAGYYGAETASCDSPFTLVNATLNWIEENLKDKVDFVVWTGDSARHDNDDLIPRNQEQLVYSNKLIADRMADIFGSNDGGMTPSVIPNLGNNDILPHNIFFPGSNEWTKRYLDIWSHFIPEEQRHTFDQGGYFHVEVIPNRLAVFSLNSLYFFDKNSVVDGCWSHDQPGYQQFMWLRAQLTMMRQRGMKAILAGHVPPARTHNKQGWDETCWQMYTLWTHQFRDVIVGSLFGHMDYDHFFLQDFDDVALFDDSLIVPDLDGKVQREALGDEISVQGAAGYFNDLCDEWSKLPKVPEDLLHGKHGGVDADKKSKKYREIGGPWAERYSLSLVSPSIIPAYYPTLRVIEYNITGALDKPLAPSWAFPATVRGQRPALDEDLETLIKKNNHERKGDEKEFRELRVKPPKGPSKSAPPGPAYSPQTFTWLGYKQYWANLTVLNNDFVRDENEGERVEGSRKGGHFVDERPGAVGDGTPHPKKFGFEVEYDTTKDHLYKLKDMTVRSYLDLARRIGKGGEVVGDDSDGMFGAEKKKKKDKKGKDKKRKHKDKKHKKKMQKKKAAKLWLHFMRRVFVGAVSDEDLRENFASDATEEVIQEL